MLQEQSATSQHPYNHNMVRPPHNTGYAMTNAQYRTPSINSQGPTGQRPPEAPQVSRPHLASMLDSPEMIALQQLSTSTHHVGNFQSTAESGGNALVSAILSSRDCVVDNQHTSISPKGKSGIPGHIFGITLLHLMKFD